jgi:RND family efflux transporter MFP subunit
MSRNLLKVFVPIIVLLVGMAAAFLIVSGRKAPPRAERPELGPLVEVVMAEIGDVPVVIKGHGEVVPKVAVDLVPQVSGKVVGVSQSLVAGGFFRAGETLITIEARDYELAVDRARAAVARARVALQREEAEAEVAREEWDQLHPGEEPPSGLVVREPQILQARAELEAANADLAFAELNLERTRISVPFDGVVVSENVDVGQFVSMGSRLALVYGTDGVEVRVPLDSREMAWFDVPVHDGGIGSSAEISTSFGGSISTWPARIARMEAQVDETSRMVHVVAEVARPYDTSAGRPVLLPGAFVDVSIFGRTLEGVAEVPRFAVHESNQIWVYESGSIDIREVEIVRADRESALVARGLGHGDLVIVTSLDAVTDGMTVRIANGETVTTGPSDGGEQNPGQTAASESAIREEGSSGGAA